MKYTKAIIVAILLVLLTYVVQYVGTTNPFIFLNIGIVGALAGAVWVLGSDNDNFVGP